MFWRCAPCSYAIDPDRFSSYLRPILKGCHEARRAAGIEPPFSPNPAKRKGVARLWPRLVRQKLREIVPVLDADFAAMRKQERRERP